MKRLKDVNKDTHQKTLAESWFSKQNTSTNTKQKSSPSKNQNLEENKETLNKLSLKNLAKSKTVRSNSIKKNRDKISNKENSSDDSDFIESSQDTHESKLRKEINKSLSKLPTKLTPQKTVNALPSCSIENKEGNSEFGDISSSVIKEEIEMFNDGVNYEPIEMKHDLSGLIFDTGTPLNSLDYSPTIMSHTVDMDALSHENIKSEEEMQDPLFIGSNDNDSNIDDEKLNEVKKQSKKPRKRFTCKYQCPYALTRNSPRKCVSSIKKEAALNKTNKTNFKLSEKLLKKLKSLNIKLKHEVPPQHKIEHTAGCHALLAKEAQEFERYGPLKRGPFKKDEDEIIKNNWKDFCKTHNWNENDIYPFLYMRHNFKYLIPHLDKRKNFVRFLANGLPWRSLYSVYYRFKRLYATLNTGPYTEAEDKKILNHMRTEPDDANNCAELAKLLNRKRHSIWQRWQKLKIIHNIKSNKNVDNRKNSKKEKSSFVYESKTKDLKKNEHAKVYKDIRWLSPLVQKFINTLLTVTSCENLEELKYQIIDQSVWSEMETKMSIHKDCLQKFWYFQLHMQLFCPEPIYLTELKIKYIKFIHKKNIQSFDDITLEDIDTNFSGITTLFLSKLLDDLVQVAQDEINVFTMDDITEYLFNDYIPILERKSEEAVLPKLLYKNSRLYCLNKGYEGKAEYTSQYHSLDHENLNKIL